MIDGLPPDSIVLPYTGEGHSVYEHGFAAFAHELLDSDREGPAGQDMLQASSSRYNGKLVYLLLARPLVAWNLATNRVTVCRALILIENNSNGRKDVYSSDSAELALTMFKDL